MLFRHLPGLGLILILTLTFATGPAWADPKGNARPIGKPVPEKKRPDQDKRDSRDRRDFERDDRDRRDFSRDDRDQRDFSRDARDRRDFDRDRRSYESRDSRKKIVISDRRVVTKRVYPPVGRTVRVLPPRIRPIPYAGISYYYSSGIWYRPYGAQFIITMPPVGITVPILPRFYTTVWVGGVPYYYAEGVYYTWIPERRVYVVTEPPADNGVASDPGSNPEELFIYPKQGQSEEQQASDRYQCHRWSVGQTTFDPTLPNGNVDVSQYADKHEDYNRAMKACLEARGYSVQ